MITTTHIPGASVRKVKDATQDLTITVSNKHWRGARQCDGNKCVVAQAFACSNLGQFIQNVEVGLTITKITINDTIYRFATPEKMRRHIREFDRTGAWNLPDGEYTFRIPSPTAKLGGRPSRWKKHRIDTDGSGRDKMISRAAPTRRITRSEIRA